MDNCSELTLYPLNSHRPSLIQRQSHENIEKMLDFYTSILDSSHPINSSDQAKLLQLLVAAGDPFTEAARKSLVNFSWSNEKSSAPIPIEHFRSDSLVPPAWATRHFMSSGTTSANRSLSPFSAGGLELYRIAALSGFLHVVFRITSKDPRKIRGFSLIPPTSQWPHSSLAQMVAWIADLCPMTYVTEDNFAEHLASFADKEPIWVFGTAFHFVNLIDAGKATKLPQGSLIFETGGTKGRSRSLSQRDFYDLLAQTFAVSGSDIISEYGMCELASQAWNFVDPQAPTQPRRFVFPAWVKTAVAQGPQERSRQGEGLLIVEDPLRIDCNGAIVTEDLVHLDQTGFSFLGRLPSAPLKGCSLAAESITHQANAPLITEQQRTAASKPLIFKPSDALKRAKLFLATMSDLLNEPVIKSSLAEELGYETLASAAIDDLRQGLPKTPEALVEAARISTTPQHSKQICSDSWIFILPDNHSIVGIYPMALGYVAGLEMTIRIPAAFAVTSHWLNRYIDKLKELEGASITCVPPSFRIGASPFSHKIGALLVYGDDETIQTLGEISGLPVSGFGYHYGITMATPQEALEGAQAIAKDAFGLAQAGCMSSRLLIVIGDELSGAKLAQTIEQQAAALLGANLQAADRAALALEACRLEHLGFHSHQTKGPYVPYLQAPKSADQLLTQLPAFIARRRYCLPMIITGKNQSDAVLEYTTALLATGETDIGTATISKKISHALETQFFQQGGSISAALRPIGLANAPAWNGLHEGRPLLVASS